MYISVLCTPHIIRIYYSSNLFLLPWFSSQSLLWDHPLDSTHILIWHSSESPWGGQDRRITCSTDISQFLASIAHRALQLLIVLQECHTLIAFTWGCTVLLTAFSSDFGVWAKWWSGYAGLAISVIMWDCMEQLGLGMMKQPNCTCTANRRCTPTGQYHDAQNIWEFLKPVLS